MQRWWAKPISDAQAFSEEEEKEEEGEGLFSSMTAEGGSEGKWEGQSETTVISIRGGPGKGRSWG